MKAGSFFVCVSLSCFTQIEWARAANNFCSNSEVITIGVGAGVEKPITDSANPNRPDFIVTNTWLETSKGIEVYQYGMTDSFNAKARIQNSGNTPCLKNENPNITGHFYLSKGYKEDRHSGDDAWQRIASTSTRCSNLEASETHTETEKVKIRDWIDEPGIYNIVFCIDHPKDDHNNGGDHKEKHESNNCSTEAVFEVTGRANIPDVDFVVSGLQMLQAPSYAGGQARFGAWIKNRGTVKSPKDIRSSYRVQCPGTELVHLTDDGTGAEELKAGAQAFEQTQSPVTLPNSAGTCTLYFCADYQEAVLETDETNNCATLSFTVAERPKPNLVIAKFEDEEGCCTTNTGDRIKPKLWVRNAGSAAPVAHATVIYQIQSPVATGSNWLVIGYSGLEPDHLLPGQTDVEHMDGKWSIPKNSAWKRQWHNVRACIRADGSTPFGDPNRGDLCIVYSRYSKK
ncbi:MAG: CARDB domain-containing protein [Candidatus Accumulibacter sp. UW20]